MVFLNPCISCFQLAANVLDILFNWNPHLPSGWGVLNARRRGKKNRQVLLFYKTYPPSGGEKRKKRESLPYASRLLRPRARREPILNTLPKLLNPLHEHRPLCIIALPSAISANPHLSSLWWAMGLTALVRCPVPAIRTLHFNLRHNVPPQLTRCQRAASYNCRF